LEEFGLLFFNLAEKLTRQESKHWFNFDM